MADAEIIWNGEDVKAEISGALVDGLNLAAEFLLGESKKQVPFDVGSLSDTGQVLEAETPEEGSAVLYDTPYAARLHEHPEYNFDTSSNPGAKGKYLEDPALEHRDTLRAIIAQKVRAAGD